MTDSLRFLLVAAAIAGTTLTGCANPPQEPEALSVMTFNIRFDNPNDGQDAWPARADWVAATIDSIGPDVFGLQEALEHQIQELADALPAYRWIGVGRDDGASQGEFSPLFYRPEQLELLDWDTLWLSPTPDVVGSKGWDSALTRIATRARFREASGELLSVTNIHFDHMGVEARRNSAVLLADSLRSEPRAVLMGDFNTADTTAAYRALSDQGWIDAFRAVSPSGPVATFSGFDAAGSEGGRIDYVFVRGLEVIRYQSLDIVRAGRHVSDHRPVVVELRR